MLGRSIVDNKICSKCSNSIAKLITCWSNLNLPLLHLQPLMLAVIYNCQKHQFFCPCSMAIILPEKKVPRGIGEDHKRMIVTKIIMVTKNIMVTKMLRTVQRTWWWWTARMAGKLLSGEGRLSSCDHHHHRYHHHYHHVTIITSPSFTAPPAPLSSQDRQTSFPPHFQQLVGWGPCLSQYQRLEDWILSQKAVQVGRDIFWWNRRRGKEVSHNPCRIPLVMI